MNKIIAIVGMCGSGKSVASEYLENKLQYKKVYFGGVTMKKLQEENISLTCNQDKQSFNTISSHVQEWDNISFEDKQSVVNALIKIIKIADGKIEILWNI